mgnify:FL=1
MKKLIFAFCAIVLSVSLSAQEYTPKKGDWALSTDAKSLLVYAGNLFAGTSDVPEVDFTDNNFALSAKYFNEDDQAWRLGFNLQTRSQFSDGDNQSEFALSIAAGKEFRRGSSRLQGLYGYESNLVLRSESYDSSATPYNDSENSSYGFGCDAFVGVEYFVKPKLSLGAEYQYGFMFYMDEAAFSGFNLGGTTTSINLNFYF